MTRSTISRARSLAFISAALAGAATTTRIAAQERTPIRIGFVAGDTFGEPAYAQQLGLFAKAGIDAQLTVLANAGAVAAAVAGGALDVATGDIVSLANAKNHGLPITLIAGGARYVSNPAATVLCVDKDSPIRTAKDLVGKRIAVITLIGLGTASARSWLAQNGVDPTAVEFLELPQSSMQPAIARGQIAAAVISEPTYSNVRDQVKVIGKPFDAIAKTFLISEWFTTPDWLAKNGAAAKRLVNVVYDTARWANAHQAESLPMLAALMKLDPAKLQSMTRVTYATTLEAADIQPVIDVALRYHAIERTLNANDLIAKL